MRSWCNEGSNRGIYMERIGFTLRFIEQRTKQFEVNGVCCGTVTDMP